MRLEFCRVALMAAVVSLAACTSNAGKRVENVGAPDPAVTQTFAQRAHARANKNLQAQWAALPADEQARLREAAAQFSGLATDKQQALRAAFEALDDVTRRGYLLGPDLGEAWPHLQPVFGYVPESERAAVLSMLRGLDRAHLYSLERVAWRTPVEGREALRAKLLGMTPAAREAWLFEQNF